MYEERTPKPQDNNATPTKIMIQFKKIIGIYIGELEKRKIVPARETRKTTKNSLQHKLRNCV